MAMAIGLAERAELLEGGRRMPGFGC
jgi:hypothetical protein